MVLDEYKINQIIQILNLERIKLIQKLEIWLYPNQINEEFIKNLESIKKEFNHNIVFKIVEEGEYKDVQNIISNQN